MDLDGGFLRAKSTWSLWRRPDRHASVPKVPGPFGTIPLARFRHVVGQGVTAPLLKLINIDYMIILVYNY